MKELKEESNNTKAIIINSDCLTDQKVAENEESIFKIGDTITWKGVNRQEKGVVEAIHYVNSKVSNYQVRTAKGYVLVAPSSARKATKKEE